MAPSRLSVALAVLVVVTLGAGLAGAIAESQDRSAPTVNDSTSAGATSGHIPPSVAQPPNTSSYLQVPDDRFASADYGTLGVDVPGALAIDRDRLEVGLAVDGFERQFDEVSSSPNRTAAVSEALIRLEATVDRARDRQETALDRYNAGETDLRALVRSLARSDATAAAITDAVDRVRERSNQPLDYSPGRRIETRMDNTEPALATLDGRIREMFVTAIRGGPRTESVVYVETGESDLVLATIFEETYIRDSYVDRSYAPAFETDRGTANDRIQELYDWGFRARNYVSVPSIEEIGNTSVFRADVTHRQGQFAIYFDSNTTSVFREIQAKRLADAQPRTNESSVSGSLRLELDVTHDTGPLGVYLSDDATGEPLNGSVFVNGAHVGTTGDDGRLWTVDAHGTAEVRVVTDRGNVSTFAYGAE